MKNFWSQNTDNRASKKMTPVAVVTSAPPLKYELETLARNWNTFHNMPLYSQRWHNYEEHWLTIARKYIGTRNMTVLEQYLATNAGYPALV